MELNVPLYGLKLHFLFVYYIVPSNACTITCSETFAAEYVCSETSGLTPNTLWVIFSWNCLYWSPRSHTYNLQLRSKTQMIWSLCLNIPKKYIRWPLPCREWCCHVISFNLADALKRRVVWFMVLITVSALFCVKLSVTLHPAVCRLTEDALRTAPHACSYHCPVIILRCCCSISRYSRLRGHLEGSVKTVVDSVW